MMGAFRSGLPSSGKLFPNGSKIAKLEWPLKKSPVYPYRVNVLERRKRLRSSKRIPRDFQIPTDGHMPRGIMMQRPTRLSLPHLIKRAKGGFACHTTVSAQDYIFTAYPKR